MVNLNICFSLSRDCLHIVVLKMLSCERFPFLPEIFGIPGFTIPEPVVHFGIQAIAPSGVISKPLNTPVEPVVGFVVGTGCDARGTRSVHFPPVCTAGLSVYGPLEHTP